MKECSVYPEDLDQIAAIENQRISSVEPNPRHHFPEHVNRDEVPKRKPGRPKGSKNRTQNPNKKKSTAEDSAEKRGRGRPPGSKNKKTLEKEAQEKAKLKQASIKY